MGQEPRAGNTFRWCWVGDFVVEVCGEGEISRAEWGALLADLGRNRARLRGVLVETKGGAPTASQREELRVVLEQGTPLLAAILTDSKVARLALTALNYFLTQEARPRPFAPQDLDDALEYLQMPRTLWLECRKALQAMHGQLGLVWVAPR
jgi:hypothetical protein